MLFPDIRVRTLQALRTTRFISGLMDSPLDPRLSHPLAMNQPIPNRGYCTDVQRELEHYEQGPIAVGHGERIVDIVRYEEVRTFVLPVLMGIRTSGRNMYSPFCFGLLWIPSLPMLLQSHLSLYHNRALPVGNFFALSHWLPVGSTDYGPTSNNFRSFHLDVRG